MKHENILILTGAFESHAQETDDGIEFWLARDLQHILVTLSGGILRP